MAIFEHGYALIIGAGADLPNTVDDARGLADILGDVERCAYKSDHIQLLVGKQATREVILSSLDELAQINDPQATVVIYFSGHGYRATASLGEFYYLMPFGYDINRLFETAISGAEFTTRLSAIKAQKLLVLLDCCHAGGLTASESPGMKLTKSPLPPEVASLLSQGQGRVLIASSKEDELSFAGRPYSAFTLALIEALCGKGVAKPDGYVRISDLALHTREVVPGRTNGRQHPILNFERADNFILTYYAAGNTQAKGLPFTEQPEIEPEPGAWQKKMSSQHTQTAIGDDNIQIGIGNVDQGTISINVGKPSRED